MRKLFVFLLTFGLLLSACQSATPTAAPPTAPVSGGATQAPAPTTEAATQAPATTGETILRMSGADLIVIDPSRALRLQQRYCYHAFI